MLRRFGVSSARCARDVPDVRTHACDFGSNAETGNCMQLCFEECPEALLGLFIPEDTLNFQSLQSTIDAARSMIMIGYSLLCRHAPTLFTPVVRGFSSFAVFQLDRVDTAPGACENLCPAWC